MKKINLTFVLLLFAVSVSVAQKNQRIAYIDMDYILQSIPQYIEAQNALNDKVAKWRSNLDKEARQIEVMKTDLANEKAILTQDLIEEREEDIQVKQDALRKLESLYFGPDGDMYILRKKLIQPIQDQVYNAVQTIASRKKYDFVFDKSSELVMLYSNKKHDISSLVLKLIKIDVKRQDKRDKIAAKKKLLANDELSDEAKKRAARKEAIKQKKLTEREAKLKAIEEKRQARLKAREEKRRLLREKKEALKKAKEEKKKQEESDNKDKN
ncbi:OmpH family outer membrane protein [uncultured Tenacibaculum sp.]|uniref:OmpH family outer membrane protein n=1 Tax=uncultured Tenacibaculum sp. TaxID=174713 RepID=UPI00262B46E7|nr:OmpH family outer membrane protein [uncultured Tenacibaculum sp.]